METRLGDLDIVKQINKKKKRNLAVYLRELEAVGLDEETYRKTRKILLDCVNAQTRGTFSIIGIDIEGIIE